MKLLVVRHGRTNWNDLKKVQGTADIELNDKGIEEAEMTAKLLENEKIDLIISSPLIRAVQTAEIINAIHKCDIICDERITERDYGEFEGLNKEEFNFIDFWTYSKDLKYNSAENIQDFFKRIFNFLDEIKEKYEDKTILIVIHGGVSVAVNSYFEGIPEEGNPTKNHLKNCEVKEFII